MANDRAWESLDVHLLRILYTLLLEGSVSRAARKLHVSQPAVSAALKRLREMTGDKLLVRARDGMAPTERGAALLEPVRIALEQLERIAIGTLDFDPGLLTRCFNLATPDYLNPTLIGDVITELHGDAPHMQLKLHSMTQSFDYPRGLELGELDLVIGNWPNPPQHLRTKRLFDDRMVVMMRAGHPLAQREDIDLDAWLDGDAASRQPPATGLKLSLSGYPDTSRESSNVITSAVDSQSPCHPYCQYARCTRRRCGRRRAHHRVAECR